MIFKIEGSEFTIEEILHHISKGRSGHFKKIVIDALSKAEAEREELRASLISASKMQSIHRDACQKAEAELTRRDAAAGEAYGYVHKSLYESIGYSGLSNDHEAYRDSLTHIALYTAAQPAVFPPPLDNWHNSASGVMQSLQFKGDELSFTVGANWMRQRCLDLGAQPQKVVTHPETSSYVGTRQFIFERDAEWIAALDAANVKYEVKK